MSNTTGNLNAFFGDHAGQLSSTGSNNTMIGAYADVASGGLSNATAIGAGAVVSESNAMVLGSNVNVGIGTSAPHAKLHVQGGSVYIANPNSLVITSPNGACWFLTVNNAGALATIAVACP